MGLADILDARPEISGRRSVRCWADHEMHVHGGDGCLARGLWRKPTEQPKPGVLVIVLDPIDSAALAGANTCPSRSLCVATLGVGRPLLPEPRQ
jgi:hypothetical protein